MYFTSSGMRVYIGGVVAMKGPDFIESDFASQTWVEITGHETIGGFGDTSQAVTFADMAVTRERTLKGTRNAGTMELVMAINSADPGQIALIAAEKSPHDFAFKVVFNDAPVDGTPSERKFIGKVMSTPETFDGANSIMKMTASIAINSNIVRKAAAEEV